MPEVTRDAMLDALRDRVAHLEYHRGRGPLGKRLHELECMRAALREIEGGGWRRRFLDCANYDALMEGLRFKNWNLSRLNRLREELEASPPTTSEGPK